MINDFFQPCVSLFFNQAGGSLDPFGHIRVPEYMGLVRLSFPPVAAKRIKTSRLAKAFIYAVYGYVSYKLRIKFPKSVFYFCTGKV